MYAYALLSEGPTQSNIMSAIYKHIKIVAPKLTLVFASKIEVGKLTQHKSKRKALRRGKRGLNHVLELFKFLKS